MDPIIFIAKTALIGLITGFIIGYLSKKISKLALFVIVLIVILSQVAIYNGYIQIDWLYWKDTAVQAIKSTKLPTSSLKEIALRNLPFSIAGLFGFIWGFVKG